MTTTTRKLPPPPLRTITFAIPDALLDRLDTLAMESNTARSQLLREATELMLDLHDGPAEILAMLVEGLETVSAIVEEEAADATGRL